MSANKRRATDFFDRQDRARRNTLRLLSLFLVVFAVLTAGAYVVLMIFVDTLAIMGRVNEYIFLEPLFNEDVSFELHPELVVGAVLFTTGMIFLGGLTKTYSLKEGGAAIAEQLGGTEVNGSSLDPLIRRYVNVVEEMSLASGLPVPRTYVLESQPAINAFAAGYGINDTAVAITRGALRQLNRDELQAVVAHEFSHILNGDMRLNIRLIGLLHGILCMYLVGSGLAREAWPSDWNRKRAVGTGRGALAPLILIIPGLALAFVGLGGMLGSRFIKSGVVRQREYLADAAAVQFTRNPDALASALKKIGGYTHGSQLRGAHAETVSHMCFGEALSTSRFTHPPLEKRIQAIDPSFNPELGYTVLDDYEERAELELEGSDGSVEPSQARRGFESALEADNVLDAIGNLAPEYLVYCATLLREIPDPLLEARCDLMGATVTAYLLLLDEEPEKRRTQAEIIQSQTSAAIGEEARKLWPIVRKLDDELRLPLMDLLLPELRRMTEEQFEEFSSVADQLIRADGEVDFREFVLERLVLHRLEATFHDVQGKGVQFNSFSGVSRDLENVLSALAFASSEKMEVVKLSFEEGCRHIPGIGEKLELRGQDRWTFEMVAASLERLSLSAPAIKRAVIDACAHCVMADAEVVVAEIEMLRAVCEILDAPLPPFIPRNTRREVAA